MRIYANILTATAALLLSIGASASGTAPNGGLPGHAATASADGGTDERDGMATSYGILPADTLVEMGSISVTAIKQGLSLRREAVSASVIGSREINLYGIRSAKEAAALSPNLFMPDYGSRMTSSIYVRGIGTRIEQPVVGMNVDNVPVADKNMYDLDMPDIERIEFLRGAQSTLYGRNAMGGVINIYTTSPLSFQGVKLKADYGSRNSYRIGASVYDRFSDRLGVSLSTEVSHCDGYFRNMYDGQLCDRENSASARFKLQYRHGALSIDNTVAASALSQGGYPYAYAGSADGGEEGENGGTEGVICYNDESSYRRAGISEGLSIRYSAGTVNVSGITSYQYLDDEMVLDQDFLPESYFTLRQARRQHDLTQEIVVSSDGSGKYGWMCGAFGFFKHQRTHAPVNFKRQGIEELILDNINKIFDGEYRWGDIDGNGGGEFTLGSDFLVRNYGWAVYHQSTLRLGRWRMALGLRLDGESARLSYRSLVSTAYTAFPSSGTHVTVPLEIDDTGTYRESYLEFLPKFSVSMDFGRNNENMLYLSAAKGYKAGGFNTQMFSEILQRRLQYEMGLATDIDRVKEVIEYKPEKSWTFEAGVHFSTIDTRLRVDASLFHIECFDQQLTVFPEGKTTGRMMTNAGRTRSSGTEVSATYMPHRNVALSVSYGHTDARFRQYVSGDRDFRGKHIPYAPSNTMSARISYTLPLSAAALERIVFSAGCDGAGRIYWDEENSVSQPFYALANASLRFEHKKWSVDLWMKNITGTKYGIFYFESMGNRFMQTGRGRSFGIRLALNI